jgi:hypothetical protein
MITLASNRNAAASDWSATPTIRSSDFPEEDFSGVSSSQSLSRGDLRDCSPTAFSDTRHWPAVDGYVGVGVLPERVEVRERGDHHVADCGVGQRRIKKPSMLVPATTQVG